MSKVLNKMGRSHFAAIMLFAVLVVSALGGVQTSNGGYGVLPAPVSVAHADIWDIQVGDDNRPSIGADEEGTTGADQVNNMLDRGQFIAGAITGVCALISFVYMIIHITKLVGAGDNDQARRKAIGGILTGGVGLALLGSSTIVIAFFWNVFAGTGG